MRRILCSLLLLSLLPGLAAAEGLVGRWSVTGQDNHGRYLGTVEISEGYAVTRSIEWTSGAKKGDKRTLVGKVAAQAAPERVEVLARRLNARTAPKTGAVKATLNFGQAIEVVERADGWVKVKVGAQQLWVSGRWVKDASASSSGSQLLKLNAPAGVAGALAEATGGEAGTAQLQGKLLSTGRGRLSLAWTGANGEAGRESWDRLESESRLVRFVLKGTDRPIADSTIYLGQSSDSGFETAHKFKTNSAGLATIPRLSKESFAAFFTRYTETVENRPAKRTDSVTREQLEGTELPTVELRYFGPRWKDIYEHMLTVDDVVGSGGFRWDSSADDWNTPILDCITTALFVAASSTNMGRRGLYYSPSLENMLKDKKGRPMVANSSFRDILSPVWGTKDTMARLARSGSVYRGVCRWPWRKMVWGWKGTSDCGCGAHVTPATILQNTDKLGRVNIISMSQAKRPEGPDHGPMSGWTMRYEYSVLVLIKRSDGTLYCYHATSSKRPESRCKTFKEEVDHWAVDSWGSQETDVRYLVWKVDDAQIDPFFFMDEKGEEFTPEHIVENLKSEANGGESTEESGSSEED